MSSSTDIDGKHLDTLLQREQIASLISILFPKLPLELRLRIWGFVDDHEVRITVTTPSKDADIKKRVSFKLHTPVPLCLHLCHETRTEGLKIYKTLFKVKDQAGIEKDEIYFNPTHDTVFISIPRCTREWIIYTGGHIHLPHTSVNTPFTSHNILRCQVSTPNLGYGKHEVETIVVVQPTQRPVNILTNERRLERFDTLAQVAGPAWSTVQYFAWKPEWWNEHWEFLFSELMKEEPLSRYARKKAARGATTSRRGRTLPEPRLYRTTLSTSHNPSLQHQNRTQPFNTAKIYAIKNFKELSRQQLQSECTHRGLPTNGEKIELQLSLYVHDQVAMGALINDSIAKIRLQAGTDPEMVALELEAYFKAEGVAEQQTSEILAEHTKEFERKMERMKEIYRREDEASLKTCKDRIDARIAAIAARKEELKKAREVGG